MLRSVRLLLVAWEIVLVAVSVVLLGSGASWAPALVAWAVLNAVGVALVLALERPRYGVPGRAGRDASSEPGPGFEPTDEVFVDPTTRRRMRVWVDPARGERRYRAESDRTKTD